MGMGRPSGGLVQVPPRAATPTLLAALLARSRWVMTPSRRSGRPISNAPYPNAGRTTQPGPASGTWCASGLEPPLPAQPRRPAVGVADQVVDRPGDLALPGGEPGRLVGAQPPRRSRSAGGRGVPGVQGQGALPVRPEEA